MSELDKLEKWLIKNGHKVKRIDEEFDEELPFGLARHQVIVEDDSGNTVFDAICHPGSYGYEQGLLEVMNGTMILAKGDDVEGWLTAKEIEKRVKKGGV